MAFSILVAIDGGAAALPGWVLAPDAHPDDKAYAEEHGENWWPDPTDRLADIAGDLHERLHVKKGGGS